MQSRSASQSPRTSPSTPQGGYQPARPKCFVGGQLAYHYIAMLTGLGSLLKMPCAMPFTRAAVLSGALCRDSMGMGLV